jgi:hypothetical protein
MRQGGLGGLESLDFNAGETEGLNAAEAHVGIVFHEQHLQLVSHRDLLPQPRAATR